MERAPSGLAELVAATPAGRDRTVDFVRALSIVMVVFGHWFISIISWRDGLLRTTGAIALTPGLWVGTWLFQVMSLFFFVGGFSNAKALDSVRRRGGTTLQFVRARVGRLLRPSLVFFTVWAGVQVVLHLADVGAPAGITLWGDTQLLRGMRPPGATLPFGPLWFLAVYLVVVTISPLTIRLDRAFGWAVPGVMLAGAVAVDVLAFVGGWSDLRYLNLAFVLLLPHQLGHLLADGRLDALGRRAHAALAFGGLAILVLLTNSWLFEPFGRRRFDWFPTIGHYPRSMLGTSAEPISNAYPPTLCFLAVGLWTIGLVLLLRPYLARWLTRPGPWLATAAVNQRIMTIYLWHMTAFLLAVLLLWPLGFGRDQTPSVRWWWERPLWIVVPGLILLGLVAVFGRGEPTPDRAAATRGTRRRAPAGPPCPG